MLSPLTKAAAALPTSYHPPGGIPMVAAPHHPAQGEGVVTGASESRKVQAPGLCLLRVILRNSRFLLLVNVPLSHSYLNSFSQSFFSSHLVCKLSIPPSY